MGSQFPAAAATAKSLESCLILCDPIDGSPPGSPIPGILQARTLEWVAISFSNVWKWKVKVKSLSFVRLLATPWTAVYQAPLSMGFSRQEYWSGVPSPSPRDAAKHTKWHETVPSNKESPGPKCPQNHCQKLSCSKRTLMVSKLFTDRISVLRYVIRLVTMMRDII